MDDTGYVRFDHLEAGVVTLIALGAQVSSQPPMAIRQILPPKCQVIDYRCSLAYWPTEQDLALTVQVEDIKVSRYGQKLFLHRLTRSGPRLTPQQRTLHAGINKITMRVPEGTYELGALPLSTYAFQPPVLRIGQQDAAFSIYADRITESTSVCLKGISRRFFPIRVSSINPHDLRSPDPVLLFLGPNH